MIGRSGERWSGISVLAARHDDDDDDDLSLRNATVCKYYCIVSDYENIVRNVWYSPPILAPLKNTLDMFQLYA